MKTAVWRREDYERLPVIESDSQWMDLLHECRQTETDITGVHVRQLDFTEESWEGLDFSRVWFEGCRLAGVRISQCGFGDVWWDGCDLSGVEFRRSRLRGCRFEKGKGVGLTASDSYIRQTRFTGWNGRYGQWSSCTLEHTHWLDCDCREALFSDCPLKDVTFSQTGLQQAQFFKTYLKGIDLTTCSLDGLSVSERMTELQGAVVDLYQAADLARMLGIVIR